MTWLFIRFYVGVLVVLLLAWFIYGAVLKQRRELDTARVIVEAHGGGARIVARELSSAPSDQRQQVLEKLRARFMCPLSMLATKKLPDTLQTRMSSGEDVACLRLDGKYCVVASVGGGDEVLCIGPFPEYRIREIEESIGGWMRVTVDTLAAVAPDQRQARLNELQRDFTFPVIIAPSDELPTHPKARMLSGRDIVFYGQDPPPSDRWYAAAPLGSEGEVVRFGPFPSFERIEQKAATTTLALVLLPAALAIAVLLRPVVRQLRHVERAAETIAAGDLSARVDERRVGSTRPLAQAFNNMAGRTEAIVRTQRELLQAVSHELRTPLSRIKFSVDLIDMAKDDAERQQRLASLDAATEDLNSLVGELLSYVRLETSEPQLKCEPLLLHEVLEVLVPRVCTLFPDVQFDMDPSGHEEVVVFADRAGLQRVLENLLSNAGRSAQSRVAVRSEVVEGATVVHVDDDGEGVPTSKRESVFEPFVRLENGTNGRGVGLGLAIVKRIMVQHGGTVEVLENSAGECRFSTYWPTS